METKATKQWQQLQEYAARIDTDYAELAAPVASTPPVFLAVLSRWQVPHVPEEAKEIPDR